MKQPHALLLERIQAVCHRHTDHPLLTCVSQVLEAVLEFDETIDGYEVLEIVTQVTQLPPLVLAISENNNIAAWFSKVCWPQGQHPRRDAIFRRLHRNFLATGSSSSNHRTSPPKLPQPTTITNGWTLDELEQWEIRSSQELQTVLTHLSILIAETEMNQETSKNKKKQRISLLSTWMDVLESSHSVFTTSTVIPSPPPPPSWACCPILYTLMTEPNDPVVVDAPCAHTVGRQTHQRWMWRRQAKQTCPVCNCPLRSPQAAPNAPLREAIEAWCTTNGYPASENDMDDTMSLSSSDSSAVDAVAVVASTVAADDEVDDLFANEVSLDDYVEVLTDSSIHSQSRWTLHLEAPPGRLGLSIGSSSQGAVVCHVSDDSPLRHDVLRGDIIVRINDTDTLSSQNAANLVTQIVYETFAETRRITILRALPQGD